MGECRLRELIPERDALGRDLPEWIDDEEAAWRQQAKAEAEARQKERQETRKEVLGLLRIFGDCSKLSKQELAAFLHGRGKTVREVALETALSKSHVQAVAAPRTARKFIRTVRTLSNAASRTPDQEQVWAKAAEMLGDARDIPDEGYRNTRGETLTYEQSTGSGGPRDLGDD